MFRHKYYVTLIAEDEGKQCVRGMCVETKHGIKTWDDIVDVVDTIEKNQHVENVVILNWKRLKG